MACSRSAFSFGTSAVCQVSPRARSHSTARCAGRPARPSLHGRVSRSRSALRRVEVGRRRRAAPPACSSASSRIWRSIRARSIATGRLARPEGRDDRGDASRRRARCRPTCASTGASQVCVAEAGLAAPGLARLRVVLAVAAVGECAVVAEPSTADALEQAASRSSAVPLRRSPAAGLRAPDLLDPRPQLVGDGRVGPPGRRPARLVPAAVPPDPAVVERVHEDQPDAVAARPGLAAELLGAHGAEGVALEQADRDGRSSPGSISSVCGGSGRRRKPEGGMAAGVVVAGRTSPRSRR